MTNTPPDLPAFPTVIDTQGGRVVNGDDYGFDYYAATIAILRARADAAMARLHRAVAFIDHVISCSQAGEWPHDEAVAASIAIGPLPEQQPKPAGKAETGAADV